MKPYLISTEVLARQVFRYHPAYRFAAFLLCAFLVAQVPFMVWIVYERELTARRQGPPAIAVLQAAGNLADNCQHRPVQYLNNVLEQDHRALKRRINASQHFRSFWCAWRTIAGYEAIHMIRKGQAYGSAAGAKVGLVHRFILGLRGDELNSQSSTPIFGSTTKSQHILCDRSIVVLPSDVAERASQRLELFASLDVGLWSFAPDTD
jgi:hypothetical protein